MNNIKRNLACCAMAVLLVGAMGASAAFNVLSVAYNKAGIIWQPQNGSKDGNVFNCR